MRTETCNTLVIGAGAAGLNAADELKKAGADVLLAADDLGGGASQNAGSDKQTYYKLSLSGGAPDSVADMARSFFAGGSMHGEHAYAMAALSARCFLKLALLGVPFPYNRWGEYVGYQTDHDVTQRATSAGPLTSRLMAGVLKASCRARGVRMVDNMTLLSLLQDAEGTVCGALFHDGSDFVAVNARNTLLATGGAALAYARRVYPERQRGATGAALRAGAAANNLCFWQYGLASTSIRWNVSGSYQQVLPAYTDGAREILSPFFSDERELLDMTFLKGYQWPFDGRKANGSSRVDRAVQALEASGRPVYLDFRVNPCPDPLARAGEEARSYLLKSGATQDTPYERLMAMNPAAVEFYRSRGLDLAREPLPVGVCAQHANGGLWIDEWWRTSLPGLYAAGEVSGAFGAYRPGGSALNETQAGSLRAATHILSHTGLQSPRPPEEFLARCADSLRRETERFSRRGGDASSLLAGLRTRMSDCAGAVRDLSGMRRLLAEVNALIDSSPCGRDAAQTAELLDTLYVQRSALSAMCCQSGFAGEAGHVFLSRSLPADAPLSSDFAFETRGADTRAVPVHPLPEGGGWFETVWREFLERAPEARRPAQESL